MFRKEKVPISPAVPLPALSMLYTSTDVQFSHSVVSDSLQPHEPSMPGLPVYHQPPESTQTHVHRAGDAIQPSHPLSSPSHPTFNLSQDRVFSNELALQIMWPDIGVAASTSVLPMNTQD